MSVIDEVRSRIDIVDVIGSYVKLTRSGRSYKGLSPFQNERTPSFFVFPDSQTYKDFSSGEQGDIFSFMMKKEWPEYVGSEAAEKVAKRSFDLMEYLFLLRKDGKLKEDWSVDVGTIGYHVPCHLKIQKIGFRSRDVMKRLPGAEITLVDKCSCMDGTWGMKTEYYELSKKGAAPLLQQLTENQPKTLASDCLIAKLQIEEGTGQEVLHPIEIVWKAYGGSVE